MGELRRARSRLSPGTPRQDGCGGHRSSGRTGQKGFKGGPPKEPAAPGHWGEALGSFRGHGAGPGAIPAHHHGVVPEPGAGYRHCEHTVTQPCEAHGHHLDSNTGGWEVSFRTVTTHCYQRDLTVKLGAGLSCCF